MQLNEDELQVDLDSSGTSQTLIALLKSTIAGLEGLEGKFTIKLRIREVHNKRLKCK